MSYFQSMNKSVYNESPKKEPNSFSAIQQQLKAAFELGIIWARYCESDQGKNEFKEIRKFILNEL